MKNAYEGIFASLQFSYCLLVWMFHGRNTENKANKLQEVDLRLVYDGSL